MVFSSQQWIVSSQQPPTHQPGELRRVDLVVELDSGPNTRTGTLLFMEAKRASATPSDVIEVEYQAFTAACAHYLDGNLGNPIWAMTCIGSTARLWVFDWKAPYLIPYFPEDPGLAAREEYVEISERGTDLVRALNYIKAHPIPPKHLVKKPASPRPANATLPRDWHDNEVKERDVSAQPPAPAVASQAYASSSQDRTTQPPGGAQLPVSNVAQPPGGAQLPISNVAQRGYGSEPTAEGFRQQAIPPQRAFEDVRQWDYGQSSTQEPNYSASPMDVENVRQWDFGQSSVQEPGYSDEAEASSAVANPGPQSAEAWVRVDVYRIPHLSRRDEYVFRTRRGHDKSTDKNDWRQAEYKGKKAWYYQHRETKYYTRKLP